MTKALKKAAITGMGNKPPGNKVDKSWKNTAAGEGGQGMITRSDTTNNKIKFAAKTAGLQ